jgi:hypothetical protein
MTYIKVIILINLLHLYVKLFVRIKIVFLVIKIQCNLPIKYSSIISEALQ